MKRILCFLLAVSILPGLAACGSRAPAPAPAPDPSPAAAAPAVPAASEQIADEVPEAEFTVYITDPDGAPVPDTAVEVCDDVDCDTLMTDESGAARFIKRDVLCTIHIVSVPVGYAGIEEELVFPEGSREITLSLEKRVPEVDYPEAGLSFYTPESFADMRGIVDWKTYTGEYNLVYVLNARYYAAAKDDTELFEELKKTNRKYINNRLDYVIRYEVGELCDLICIRMDEEAAEAYLRSEFEPDAGWDSAIVEKLASIDGLTCFAVQTQLSEEETGLHKAAMGDFFDEYMTLRENLQALAPGIALHEPVPETILFKATDLDGNEVDLADVFAGAKVTMINFWDTGCKPCIQEMPYLETLSGSFGELDCQLIGICLYNGRSSDAAATAAKAKTILKGKGVSYLNLVADEYTPGLPDIRSNPTTYYVDSEGRIVAMPVLGAPGSKYRSVFTERLMEALERPDLGAG